MARIIVALLTVFLTVSAKAEITASVMLASTSGSGGSGIIGGSAGYFFTGLPIDLGIEGFAYVDVRTDGGLDTSVTAEPGLVFSLRKEIGPVYVKASGGVIHRSTRSMPITVDDGKDNDAAYYSASVGYAINAGSVFVSYGVADYDIEDRRFAVIGYEHSF